MNPASSALQALPVPLLVFDADDRVVAASDGLARVLGPDAPALEGLPLDDLPGPLAGLGALLKGTSGDEIRGHDGALFVATCRPVGAGALVTFERAAEPAVGLEADGLDAARVLASISDAFFALDADWRFTFVNAQAEPLLDRSRADLLGKGVWEEFPEAVGSPFWDSYHEAVRTGRTVQFDAFYEPLDRHFAVRAYPYEGGLSVYFADVTETKRAEAALRERTRELEARTRAYEAVVHVNALLAAELDPDRLVQSVVDAGRELTGAAYAAFFYTPAEGPAGDRTGMLYTLSGAPREAFEGFPPLQLTPLFHPTFSAGETVRADDVRADGRYGRQAPHGGMPEGHLPVRSYLAVPVRGPEGTALGALLFGHPDPAVFGEAAERAAQGLAYQAALALRNARHYADLRVELEERERAERALRQSERQFRQMAEAAPQIVWTTTPDGYHDYFNERWYAYTGMPRPHEPGGEDLGGRHGFR